MHDKEKILAAKYALQFIQPSMTLGIGSGSTISLFIPLFNQKVLQEKMHISCVCASKASQILLNQTIPLLNSDLHTPIDLTFDSADFVDKKNFVLIKGGGGCLLREKLIAVNSKKNIILIDASKIRDSLSQITIPVEIITFGYKNTMERIAQIGCKGKLRLSNKGNFFLSENGNYICDLEIDQEITSPASLHTKLKQITGVVETGLFLHTTTSLIIAHPNESIEVCHRKRQCLN